MTWPGPEAALANNAVMHPELCEQFCENRGTFENGIGISVLKL